MKEMRTSGGESLQRSGNCWIYQKNCYVCFEQLGYGQRRVRKRYCRECRRAVCANCASPSHLSNDKETLCLHCANPPAVSSVTNPRFPVPSRQEISVHSEKGKEIDASQTTVEEVLRSAKDLLGDLRSKASVSSSQSSLKSSSRLAQLHSQLTDYDTELVDVRRQVSYYAERLDHRESSIDAMAEEMKELAMSNQRLAQRLRSLEESLRGGERSERSCVSCVLF